MRVPRSRFGLPTGALAAGVWLAAAVAPGPTASVTIVPVTVVSTPHDSAHHAVTSAPYGTTIHDRVSVFETLSEVPVSAGSVVVEIFLAGGGVCSGLPVFTSGAQAIGATGVADVTSTVVTPVPGVYGMRATYNGSHQWPTTQGACRQFTITKATPDATVTVHTATHDAVAASQVGPVFHAAASVKATVATPTGTITIERFENDSCTGSPVATSGALALSGAGVDATGLSFDPDLPGIFSHRATYGGDSKFNGVVSDCVTFRVTKVQRPQVLLFLLDSQGHKVEALPFGQPMTAHIEVSTAVGVAPATGTATLERYPGDGCTGTPVNAAGSVTPAPLEISSTPPVGKHWFRAVYSGDDRYVSGSSTCLSFEVTAVAATPPAGSSSPPGATATPGVPGASAQPSAGDSAGAGSSITPSGSAGAASTDPSSPGAPFASGQEAGSAGPATSATGSGVADPSTGSGDGAPAAGSPGGVGGVVIGLIVALVVLLVGGAGLLLRRRPRPGA